MYLVELIERYVSPFGRHWDLEQQSPSNQYGPFIEGLLRLPHFTYTRNNMVEVIKYMAEKDFKLPARFRVVVYAMRRASLDSEQDFAERMELWELLEIGYPKAEELKKEVQDYLMRNGKLKLEQHLLQIKRHFEEIKKDVDTISVSRTQNIPFDNGEYHDLAIRLEILRLDNILEILHASQLS
ncbi:hypothetical protein HYT92_02520 [Candidatus Pacearchaeota archaeon]|nr:hypothetical protein [Candidatus Pacearchaeota archaeon]